jgi:hypothetical protein
MKMERFLFLSTRGRNSGLWRPLEVWFVELAGTFYLLAESQERPDWVKNIEANPEVRFSIGTRRNETSELPQTHGRGRVLSDANDGELCTRVRASMYGKYRWSSGTLIEIL